MSNFLRGETHKQRQELVYPYTELGRLKWRIGAFLALLPGPVEAASGSVCLNTDMWLWQPQRCSRGTAGIRVLGNGTTEPQLAPALEEVGEGADKGNCGPQSAAGETSTRQKGEQAPGCHLNHLAMAGGTPGVGNMPAHTCTQPWQRPSPSTGCATQTGLHNYPGELFIPILQFLFSKSMHFRESMQFD